MFKIKTNKAQIKGWIKTRKILIKDYNKYNV